MSDAVNFIVSGEASGDSRIYCSNSSGFEATRRVGRNSASESLRGVFPTPPITGIGIRDHKSHDSDKLGGTSLPIARRPPYGWGAVIISPAELYTADLKDVLFGTSHGGILGYCRGAIQRPLLFLHRRNYGSANSGTIPGYSI